MTFVAADIAKDSPSRRNMSCVTKNMSRMVEWSHNASFMTCCYVHYDLFFFKGVTGGLAKLGQSSFPTKGVLAFELSGNANNLCPQTV